MAYDSPVDEDPLGVYDILRNDARVGNIAAKCRDYLNTRTYRHAICLDTGEYADALELYTMSGSSTIQKIIDDHQELDTIHLRRPAPNILPIIISRIANDNNSYIIPSERLNIHALLPRAPRYHLEAVICEINQHEVVFLKDLLQNRWYYYQKDYECDKFSSTLNDNLNYILESRSVNEQIRLIQSAHFLVSLIFHHAVKYVYKPEE